jgi:molybdopterin-guanine dinucleotide biosynthesis protein A
MPTFSAALIAGGQSSRMGRDKALLTVHGSDCLLWQRQLHTLEALNPQKILWSGRPRPGLPVYLRVVPDEVANAGPLAGISACLNQLESDLLIVLAIDLPRMSAAFLRTLLTRCSDECGAVVQQGGFFEPLAAIYPRSLHILATEHLNQKRLALQELMREAVLQGLLKAIPLDESDALLFKNVNSPADLEDV